MRTTIDLDDDVLQATKEIAARRGVSAGKAASDLIRKALEPKQRSVPVRNGVPLLLRTNNTAVMTMKLVNELRDE